MRQGIGTMNQVMSDTTVDSARSAARRLGFWIAILTAALAVITFAVGVTTPPRSGPFCAGSCITYPYTDAAAFVPRDYLWMYPASLLAVIVVVLMTCIHQCAPDDRKIWNLIGLSFASVSAAVILIDYSVQLAVVQPSLVEGETAFLSLWSQYNPHGIFIAFEDLGYLMMAVAFLFVAGVFRGSGLGRALRWLFLIGSLLAIGALVAFSLYFGLNLEYRFEVAVLTIDWAVLIVAGVLLSILFRREARESSDHANAS
jgi:hypothetical protein